MSSVGDSKRSSPSTATSTGNRGGGGGGGTADSRTTAANARAEQLSQLPWACSQCGLDNVRRLACRGCGVANAAYAASAAVEMDVESDAAIATTVAHDLEKAAEAPGAGAPAVAPTQPCWDAGAGCVWKCHLCGVRNDLSRALCRNCAGHGATAPIAATVAPAPALAAALARTGLLRAGMDPYRCTVCRGELELGDGACPACRQQRLAAEARAATARRLAAASDEDSD